MSGNNGHAIPARGEEERLVSSLRQFVRTQGAKFLQDPNVTSIGIGRRSSGPDEGRLAVQFTVGTKVTPEGLAALGTEALPSSVVVDGVEVPTEVIERSYAVHFRTVAETASPARKTRLDPVPPGVSIGNAGRRSAGTLGCVVFDRTDGTPYVLTNWHVLHGPDGRIGDPVVQPGAHDDNRVELNRLGTLVRSHLGVAGDCAVASITDRRFDPAIMDLGVVPEELGEPELGDRVVKSGRTTGVTHGVVRRVDTIVKIDYGGQVGEQAIGCFEIGVDPADPPDDGEVSSGGDSGSAWMFADPGGRPTRVLAGLHFGGETGDNPDEHALACLPASVFEKLEISLSAPAPEALEAVAGYDADFLGVRLEVPELHPKIEDDAVVLDGSTEIRYTHFSLAHSRSRRFALWVAWNVDGGTIKKLNRSGIPFVKDPRLPFDVQVGDELYRGNRLDRGHIARRADLLWGGLPAAKKANRDSFFFTNITPQMDDFNQSAQAGVWGRLEDAVFEDVDVQDLKVSIFGGPVFQDDDRLYRGVRIPREFWKVIVFVEDGRLLARAFLLTQNLDQLEALELDEFRVFQISLSELEERVNLRFPVALRRADDLAVPESAEARRPLSSTADIRWH
ncbi:DNA/RNA non-specific endonuclease [Kitasatospora camelliae]|uniref:DNA/RNA non-specific endonuclease n=1 Tax=Kitasatospora camelliae TaxID=3156397 RepID=A0AAU8K782_9ACTN